MGKTPAEGAIGAYRARAVLDREPNGAPEADAVYDEAELALARGPSSDRWTRGIVVMAGAWAVATVLSFASPTVRAAFLELDHTPGWLVDFDIYYDQVQRLVSPKPSLSPHWLYPPMGALLLLGFGPLSIGLARGLWAVIQALLTVWLMLHCASQMPSLHRWERRIGAAGLVLTSLPILHGLKWGQVSVLVTMLAVIGLSRADWSGPMLLGTAIALKFYPVGYALAPAGLGRIGWLAKLAAAVLMVGVGLPAIAFGPEVAGMLLGRSLGSALEISRTPELRHETLDALIRKWLGSADDLTGSPGALLFALPSPVVQGLGWLAAGTCLAITVLVCRRRGAASSGSPLRQLPARSSRLPRSDQPIDPADVIAAMLCTTLVVQPASLHYFAMLPIGHAILLERARGRRAVRALLLMSFLLSAGSLSTCLISPGHFHAVQRFGTLSLSALLCLIGLWICGPVRAARDRVGSAP